MSTAGSEKTDEEGDKAIAGELLYCGSTNWKDMGRKGGPATGNLLSPTRLWSLVGVDIRFVASGCTSCHCVALDVEDRCYTWGRNEKGQLGHGDTLQLTFQQLCLNYQRIEENNGTLTVTNKTNKKGAANSSANSKKRKKQQDLSESEEEMDGSSEEEDDDDIEMTGKRGRGRGRGAKKVASEGKTSGRGRGRPNPAERKNSGRGRGRPRKSGR